MKIRNMFLLFAAIGITVSVSNAAPSHNHRHSHSLSLNVDDDATLTDCSQVKARFDDRDAARAEQQLNFSPSEVATLRVRASESTGMRVQGWDRNEYAVKACKAAAAGDDSQKILGQISVTREGNELVVKGPSPQEDSWIVYLIIQAPRNAAFELESENGEISARDLSGSIRARNDNGPISFRKCSGTLDAETTNGPIDLRESGGSIRAESDNGPVSYSGNSGSLKLRSENGPMSVRLTGTAWQGAGLEGRTENGPLTLDVPKGFASGVLVEARGDSPFNCEAAACDQALGKWHEQDRSITMGKGEPLVRLSTVNGPVTIGSGKLED
ncbi:MAG: hypothetical protein ACRD59_00760 [Candidatus Acidiferrales bacterium]